MYLQYRYVWNPFKELLTITPSSVGYDATLNNKAGMLFEQLASDSNKYKEILSLYPSFVEQCQKYNWITKNGKLNGTFSKIDQEPHLKRIQIELTRHCNLRCGYCYSMSGPNVKTKLFIEQIENILEDALNLGCIWVDFTGGEPLLHSHWKQSLMEARKKGMSVSVHSNGTLLTRENLEFLAETGINHLQVSADSHIAGLHDSIRGSKGSHSKMVKAIKTAQDLGLKVRVTLMAHKGNQEHFAEMVQWFSQELGVSVLLDRVIATGGELNTQTGISSKEYYELIEPLTKRNIASTRICDNKADSAPSLIEPHCGVAHSFVYITAEGEFALCPTMTSRDRSFFTGPNISDISLKKAWLETPYFNNYRYTNCSNIGHCPTAKNCGGGCRSNAYFETGDIHSPDLISCNMQKNSSATFVDFLDRYNNGNFGFN